MFDIGWSELLVIAIVAIVVVGPKELPRLMRTFGHYAGKLRRAASDFQRQFEEAVRDSEAEEVRKNIENIRAGFDNTVMLPRDAPGAGTQATKQPALAPAPGAKQPASKRAPAKTKASGKTASQRRKTKAEPRP
jgi:sec-independent protein translocase protein TatB